MPWGWRTRHNTTVSDPTTDDADGAAVDRFLVLGAFGETVLRFQLAELDFWFPRSIAGGVKPRAWAAVAALIVVTGCTGSLDEPSNSVTAPPPPPAESLSPPSTTPPQLVTKAASTRTTIAGTGTTTGARTAAGAGRRLRPN